jgi:hypothetical protein
MASSALVIAALLEQLLDPETGKCRRATNPGSVADIPQGTNVQVCCRVEETSCLEPTSRRFLFIASLGQ